MTQATNGASTDEAACPATGSTRWLAGRWWDNKWFYLVLLFVAAKLIWTMVGLICVPAFGQITQAIWTDPHLAQLRPDVTRGTSVTDYNAYTMWFRWDSIQYIRMGEFPFLRPLDPVDHELLRQAVGGKRFIPTFSLGRFAWAPLYMLLGKGVSILLGGNVAGALFLVANIAFFGCLYYAYGVGEHLFGTPEHGRACALFLCLLPTGFLLQAVLSEGLFVCLLLATLYYLSRRRWLLAGVTALALGLTRSSGFLMAIPFGLLVLHMCSWRIWKAETWLTGVKALPALLGAPLGWAIFMGYCKYMTGYSMAYTMVQSSGWGVKTSSPLVAIADELNPIAYTFKDVQLVMVFVTAALLLVCLFRMPVAYAVVGFVLLTTAMAVGSDRWGYSILRYIGEVFPSAFLVAWATIRWRTLRLPVVCAMVALESGMFILWTLDWLRAII